MNQGQPADLDVKPAGKGLPTAISWIWLVPLVALVIALFIAWQTISSRGPLIEITFENTEGITEGQTVLKYRDVNVGLVEGVRFADDLKNVIVEVRLDETIAEYVDEDSQFWIIRPRVSARGVTGLETVLSGVHLEGSWDSQKGATQTQFTGMDNPPLVRADQEGLEILLRAPQGGRLEAGAPILHRGVTVGYIDTPVLSEDGTFVTSKAFIKAPHDVLVKDGTRFWGASGFSVNLNTSGLSLNVGSIASLLEGGLSFDTFQSNSNSAAAGTVFEVFEDETTARDSTFELASADSVVFASVFEGSLSGLAAGAPVEFRGLRVGTVETITAVLQEEGAASSRISVQANLRLEPRQFGLSDDSRDDELIDYMRTAVTNGLRARLASQGLLNQSMKIELLNVDGAPPAEILESDGAAPIIPTTDPAISDVAESARGVMNRIQELPIEELLHSATTLMSSMNTVIASQEVQAAPKEVIGLVTDIRQLVEGLPVESLDSITLEAQSAISDLRGLMANLSDSPAMPSLLSALDQLDSITQSVDVAAGKLPELLDSIQQVSAKAAGLDIDELFTSVNSLVDQTSTIVGSEEFAALPASISGALGDLRLALADVQTVTGRVAESEALDSLISALARTDAIAASIETSAEDVPALIEDISELAEKANTLPLEELTASASSLLASADTLLGSEAALALPDTLNTALENLSGAVSDVRLITSRLNDSAALASVIAALERTESIARSLDTTAAGLPALVEQIDSVAAKADALPMEDLFTSATELVNTADTLIGSDDTAKIPAQLAFALEELGYSLEALRDGGAIENTNATLASASEAAKAIELAASSLPSLTSDLEQLIAQSESVLGTYGERSEFNAQTLAAIRDLRDTARALTSLARTIERKPNSLLIGR